MAMRFGEMAQEARKARGVTLRAVAEHLSVTPVYVSDMERGFRVPPRASKVRSWAVYLGADVTAWERQALRERSDEAAELLDEIDRLSAENDLLRFRLAKLEAQS